MKYLDTSYTYSQANYVFAKFAISPTIVIPFPRDTNAVFPCQASNGVLLSWKVNEVRYTPEALSNGNLSGHSVNGTNITVYEACVYGTCCSCYIKGSCFIVFCW